jgi:hypothetical protein
MTALLNTTALKREIWSLATRSKTSYPVYNIYEYKKIRENIS